MFDLMILLVSWFAAFIMNYVIKPDGEENVSSAIKSSLIIGAAMYFILKVCIGLF